MSIFQESLYQYLSTHAPLVALIEDRVYPLGAVPPTAPLPYMSWQKIDNVHVRHQGGASGLENPRYQFDVWAESEVESQSIFKVLRIALDSYRGLMGDTVQTAVRLIAIDSDREEYSPPRDGTEKAAYRSSGDFLVWNVEEV